MPNFAIEFHDSKLLEMVCCSPGVLLALDAYVHSSTGTPGVDSGIGLIWRAELRLSDARTNGSVSENARIMDGTVHTPQRAYENMIGAPLKVSGPVRIELSGHGWSLDIEGTELEIDLVGEGRFVEDVP